MRDHQAVGFDQKQNLDPQERNPAKMDQQNTTLEVNQVQTAPKAGFGWQAALLLTIAINLLTTLFLCFRLNDVKSAPFA